jgi:glycosyltransferase involved in cell wall biosynthesis
MMIFFRHHHPCPSGPVTVCNLISKALGSAISQTVDISINSHPNKNTTTCLMLLLLQLFGISKKVKFGEPVIYALSGTKAGHMKDLLVCTIIRVFVSHRVLAVCIGNYSSSSYAYNIFKRVLFSMCSIVVHEAPCEYTNWHEKHVVIRNPSLVSQQYQTQVRQPSDHFCNLTVGFYSNFIKAKRVDLFAKICCVLSKYTNVSAVLVGVGKEQSQNWLSVKQVDQLLQRADLFDFTIKDDLLSEQAVAFMSSCDLVIFCSQYEYENLPITMLDCMMAGVPVAILANSPLTATVPSKTFISEKALLSYFSGDKTGCNALFSNAQSNALVWATQFHSWEVFEKAWLRIHHTFS